MEAYIAYYYFGKISRIPALAGPNTKEYQGIPRLVFWANQRRPAEYQGYQAISEYQGIPNTWYTQTLIDDLSPLPARRRILITGGRAQV